MCFCGAERKVAPDADDFLVRLDPGIREAVRILKAGGVETYESCEGGLHHAYPEPTVRFHGERGEGLKALSLAIVHALPVQALRRIWTVIDGEPTGPHWEMVFSKKAAGPGHMSPRSEGGQDIGAATADAPDNATGHRLPAAALATEKVPGPLLRPCTCGHSASAHVSYHERCDRCDCKAFEDAREAMLHEEIRVKKRVAPTPEKKCKHSRRLTKWGEPTFCQDCGEKIHEWWGAAPPNEPPAMLEQIESANRQIAKNVAGESSRPSMESGNRQLAEIKTAAWGKAPPVARVTQAPQRTDLPRNCLGPLPQTGSVEKWLEEAQRWRRRSTQEIDHALIEALRLYRAEHKATNARWLSYARDAMDTRLDLMRRVEVLQAEREEWQSQLAVANAMVDGLKAERDGQLRRLDAAHRRIEGIEQERDTARNERDAGGLPKQPHACPTKPESVEEILAKVASEWSRPGLEIHRLMDEALRLYRAEKDARAAEIARRLRIAVEQGNAITELRAERDEANRQFRAERQRRKSATKHIIRVGAERDRAWVAIKQALDHARRLIQMMGAHPGKTFPCRGCDAEAGHIVAALRDGGQP